MKLLFRLLVIALLAGCAFAQLRAEMTLEDTQTETGNKAFTGQNQLSNVNTLNVMEYVGSGITTWSGSDIGAQINSAYAACPSTGCRIHVVASSTCYLRQRVRLMVDGAMCKVPSVKL